MKLSLDMKHYLLLALLLYSIGVASQSLREINYNYLYNPNEKFSFTLKPVRTPDGWKVLYRGVVNDTASRADEFTLQWEGRQTLGDKEGTPLPGEAIAEAARNEHSFSGFVSFGLTNTPQLVVAKVTHTLTKRVWHFYTALEPGYPKNNYLMLANHAAVTTYLPAGVAVSPGVKTEQVTISFYNDIFPPAVPVYSESQGRVSKGMMPDSVFTTTGEGPYRLDKKGLYLIQHDTTANEGLAFRVEDDYPRYSRMQNLLGPMVYICSKEEYDRLELAKGDKKAFDQVILSFTNSTERAKKLIRNYYRRVELANEYFTSYKEGWKTDRGMIYIIFGLPDQVQRFNDRETWRYENSEFNVAFTFVKASSIFDPDNYVLIRRQEYKQTCYEVIDLWRKARY